MLEYCIVSKNMVILPGRVKPPFGRQKAPFGRVKAPFQKLKKMVFPQQPWHPFPLESESPMLYAAKNNKNNKQHPEIFP